ncbi:MAG: amino acid ABC transporter permease [Rhodobacterales bacterium]|nr:MAG: amino acid ABC transporter permease [Rhodobacterales bacterium]
MSDVFYVRSEMLPEQAPPASSVGIVGWLRANLFSTWLNSLLTVAAAYVIYLVLSGVLPWLFGGVWNTTSLAECREVLQGEVGGCFSVLTERWNQLLYGFKYPDEHYWRPNLALLLLAFAVAPVLFFDLPRKMLLFTAIYPFIAYSLIWGGPIGVPVTALLGFVGAYAVFQKFNVSSFVAAGIGAVVTALAIWMIGGYLVEQFSGETFWFEPVVSRDLGGFMLNLMLGVTCVSLSLPVGIALALGRQSNLPLIKGICVVFIEFVRGVPLITLLFVASVMLAYFFPPEATVDLFLRVVIMITLFSAAYIAEVIRGGLAALPTGQYEAADSLGLDYPQAMRFIILPQALKISIPGIVNVAVGLFKDTTLVSVISMFDLVGMIRGPILASTEWNGVYWELLGFAAFLFFIVCYGISQYSQWLERRLATGHR